MSRSTRSNPPHQGDSRLARTIRAAVHEALREAIRDGLLNCGSQPLAYTIEEAARACATSRSTIYNDLRDGLRNDKRQGLRAKKWGKRSIILAEVLVEHLRALPDFDGKGGPPSKKQA
ncbi:MAG: hypothetical protein ACHQAQ_05585, partial [Hyphomicrobiales bacterium]